MNYKLTLQGRPLNSDGEQERNRYLECSRVVDNRIVLLTARDEWEQWTVPICLDARRAQMLYEWLGAWLGSAKERAP